MKVLHVIPSMSPQDGGPSHAMQLMARSLAAQGVDVEICTTGHEAEAGSTGTAHVFARNTEFYKFSAPFARWLTRHIADYDLVHVHALFSFAPNVAAWTARRRGVPYVLRPLGTLDEWGMRNRHPGLKRLSLRWIEGPLLHDAAAVHFTSPAEQAQAESLGLRFKGVVVPLAVAPPEPGEPGAHAWLGLPEDRRLVLFMSRLDAKKNVEAVIDAFAHCAGDHPGAHLVIAGEGDASYAAALRQRAAGLGIGPKVTWPGHVSGDLKGALLRDSSVFLMPSFSENFGIAAAEALAAGLPCILGEGVALAPHVRQHKAGFAVAPDGASVAAALHSMLTDESMRAAMAQRARELAAGEFSPALMGERLRHLYEDILAHA